MSVVGRVTRTLQAVVPIRVGDPTGPVQTIQAVVDTGFGAFLALQQSIIDQLQLQFVDFVAVRPANGELMRCAEHIARVDWLGGLAEISVLSLEAGPLLGMGLLHRCRVSLDVVAGGTVEITPR